MAKLTRESRLRERRVEKQARKEIRRSGAESHPTDARWPIASDSHPADSPPEGPSGA